MPVMDAEQMFRDGTTVLNTTETGDDVDLATTPINDLMVVVQRPLAGTSFVLYLEETDTSGASYSTVPGWPKTFTTAGINTYRLYSRKRYLRHRVSACTGSFGAVQIGLMHGGIELS